MGLIDDKFNYYCDLPSDINEHMLTLQKYAKRCSTIVEFGTRGIVSTWAFLSARPEKIICVDIISPSYFDGNLEEVYSECLKEGIGFKFILGSSLEVTLDAVDLLFIDTIHTYEQLSQELKKHSDKVKKYIIMHDVFSCSTEMLPAIAKFLNEHSEWRIADTFENNNGLMVLERCL